MKIKFTKLPTTNGTIKVSLDGGDSFKDYNIADIDKSGVPLSDSQDYEKIQIQAPANILKNLNVVSSVKVEGGEGGESGVSYTFEKDIFEEREVTYYCFAQDNDNRVWIGTDRGLFVIPEAVDFFTSNACRRIIIPRNDGSGLGDYLLGEEQINCLAVDGGNRMWIGTANSGLYLIEDDTITVAQFTETNSLLPSNNVLSIAIEPTTGEVFVGTERGIASYRSDASEAQEDMKNAYAFPNPVRPDYGGLITITGLMENTTVNIVDARGNLVCKTRSNGGTAVWDGKDAYGKRATPGVYTALCNANGGHTAVKILVIR